MRVSDTVAHTLRMEDVQVRNRIGAVLVISGIGLLVIQLFMQNHATQQEYAVPSYVNDSQRSVYTPHKEQVLRNNIEVPHRQVITEVSEEEAKKNREAAGYSSDGVLGGVIVGYEEIQP